MVVPERDVDACEGARWQTMPGDGMAPTVLAKEALAWVAYADTNAPAVGDVVVFRVGDGPDDVHVSRVVGVGPSHVTFVDHLVVTSGDTTLDHATVGPNCEVVPIGGTCAVFEEAAAGASQGWRVQRHATSDDDNGRPTGTWTIPERHVFVAGDNRVVSQDSRAGPEGVGRPLPLSVVLGHVVAVQRDGRCAPLSGG